MKFDNLKQQFEAARLFSVTVDGATFKLRLPTDHAWRVAVETFRDRNNRFLEAQAYRSVLDTAVVGWESVTARHFMPEGGDEAVAYSQPALALLLDNRQDIIDRLGDELGAKYLERRAAMETARKNS